MPSSGYPFTQSLSSPYPPSPTMASTEGPPGARRANEAAQRSPLILLLSPSRLTLGYPLDKSWDRSGTSRPPLPRIHPQRPQLLLHTNGAPLTQQLGLPLLFLSFPPSTGTRKDLEPLAGLQGNNSIIDNKGEGLPWWPSGYKSVFPVQGSRSIPGLISDQGTSSHVRQLRAPTCLD